MIAPPTSHAAAAMILAVLMFAGFASGRVKVEIVCLGTIVAIAMGLYFFPLPGADAKDGLALAFAGFGHYALITICALMVMGRGLVVTGALTPAADILGRLWRVNRQLGMLATLVIAMGMSMVVNDTPVLVLLIPILAQIAGSGGLPASRTLIPVNAAVLIGGMATTIGTSTNLLVMSIATDLGMPALGVFHFTPIVLMAALVALPYIWLVMPRLLPDNSPIAGQSQHRFLATLHVAGTITEAAKRAEESQANKAGLLALRGVTATPAGAHVHVLATQDVLETTMRELGATPATPSRVAQIRQDAGVRKEDLNFAEMVVTRDSTLVGQTVGSSVRWAVVVIGLDPGRSSGGRSPEVDLPVEAMLLAEGDVLLVMGSPPALREFAQEEGLLLLHGERQMPRSGKAVLALLIMGISVALATFGLLPIAISALGGAVLMLLTGCVRFDRVGQALSAKVVVLIAASIAIGRIILESGAAAWLGELLAGGLQSVPAAGVLAAIMLFVTLLTNFASNATAAAVGTPIAFSLAGKLGLPVEPLVLAVLFGCNLCYATPVAYQTNMLVMVEGKYEFGDYLRTGVPLVILMVISFSLLLSWKYGL